VRGVARPRQDRWGRWYCLAAGTCDTLTGLLLVSVPLSALSLMGVPDAPAEPIFLRWVGVFVGSIGLFYLYPFAIGDAARANARWRTVLETTALARFAVALFVAGSMATGALSRHWASVFVTDLALASFQCFLLRRGMFADD